MLVNVAIDLSAAFATLDHSTLYSGDLRYLSKSPVHHFYGDVITFDNRQQSVQLGSSTSKSLFCKHSVPQSSLLDPLMFTIYVSPITNVISSFRVDNHQYADDTAHYICISKDDIIINIVTLENARRLCVTCLP